MLPSDQQLEDWDRAHVWHPFTAMQDYAVERPLIVREARGCVLVDQDGKEYIDGVSSLWCNVHGHRVPELDDAIRRQLEKVAHGTLLGSSNVPAIQLARKLVEIAPRGLTRVYLDDGATAVEVALKMAFQFWRQCARPEKTKFLALTGAYHGDTLGDVSVGDIGRFRNLFAPLLFPTLRAPGYRHPDCAAALVSLVETHADTLAAVVLEPLMQGAAGMLPAPDGLLRQVREATRKHDVLLIADEVAVGFGRTGTLFACEQEAVVPDFLCLAKGITGGYLPLAATLTTEEVFSAFLGDGKTFYHGHTYTGNPLAAAVAFASIELLEKLLPELPVKAERLARHLERIGRLPGVGDVRQRGLMAGIELMQSGREGEAPAEPGGPNLQGEHDQPRDPAEPARREPRPPGTPAEQTFIRAPFPAELRMGQRVCRRAREAGVLLRPLGDVVVIMPPLAIELSLLDRLCEVIYNSIRAVVPEVA